MAFQSSAVELNGYTTHLVGGPDELSRTVDLGFDVVESDASSDLVQGHVEEARAMVGEAQDVLPVGGDRGIVLAGSEGVVEYGWLING